MFAVQGTWKGGREKAPAAFARKVLAATCLIWSCAAALTALALRPVQMAVAKDGDQVEMWGNGKQTRSFCYIDDCVEGILRLMKSDYTQPLNIGSDECVSMNDMMLMAASFDDKKITLKHIPGPEGVRGRNSDNTRIKEVGRGCVSCCGVLGVCAF